MTDNRTQAAAMLTEQGKADSRALGRSLGRRIRRTVVWHSPLPRCRDTAACIASGMAETRCEVRGAGSLDWLSGDFFGADRDWANQEVAEGSDNFLRKWSASCYSEGRIMHMREAADLEIGNAIRQMEEGDTPVVIDVTHDWNILALRETYLGLYFEDAGLPDYLDSAAILRKGRELTVWSIGCSRVLKA